MKWADLAARERRMILIGGAVMGSALLVRFLLLPYAAAVAETRAEVDREWELLRSERALLQEASGYSMEFGRIGARFLEGMPKLLPGETPAVAQAELARRLDGAAAGTAVLNRVEPLAPRVLPTGYIALPVRVEGQGDLEGLLSLLSYLEGGPVLFHLEDLSVDAATRAPPGTERTGSGVEVLSFRFTATGFALDESSIQEAAHRAGAGRQVQADTSPVGRPEAR